MAEDAAIMPEPDPHGTARTSPTRRRWAVLSVWGALGAALGYILVSNPADTRPDALGGCSWYALFGTNGPTCGGTRMVWYLLHADLVNAARMHLIAFLGTPFALYALAAWTAREVFGRQLPRLPLRGWMIVTYVVVFVVYGAVLRNLPAFAWFHLDYMQAGVGL